MQAVLERARAEQRLALITYVIPGHPSPAETDAIFDAMVEGGADMVEVGIPFSDPLADGATIQRVAFKALEYGITAADCIAFVRRARQRHPTVPIVFMTYLNPVFSYGLQRFATDASAAGADAVILVDLPPEDSDEARETLAREGLDLIVFAAPTSGADRLEMIAKQASGFVYCVSVTGVTGARDQLPQDLREFLGRVRRCTPVPLAVGFGISRREHLVELYGAADAVVVASAIMNLIDANAAADRTRLVREYVEVLTGRRAAQT